MKRRKKSYKRRSIIVVVLLILLFFSVNLFFPIIPILQCKNNAIILIIGDFGTFNNLYYNDEFLAEKYEEYWKSRAEDLKKIIGWEVYFCYEKTFNFQLNYFKNLLVIIEGHGAVSSYYNSHYIVINKQDRIYASEFKPRCSNLTLVIDSCYSYNWYSDFSHKSLNGLFTSDLSNKRSCCFYQYIPFEPYNNMTIQRYDRFFLDAFLNGLSYHKANETAWINMTQFGLDNC
ncbi:MAG: hypothetical protein ACTSP3_02435 [Candidatus Heimdallarchaeaceae archaeon]